ncbi:Bug family tripartite tricarboxylate transporter substrate binding protein [Desulforhopalus singaporensis]|uniref:Tripartite-type tricarboxylate transporter, receptor component TctC n=1 Tax=Desulforhopalus singaporensis TaxID=91360 RepID=A0A1H0VP01_9BACT|nr:tripartite tricarboxylate transporter substrate binding protein [Desulforhopalus singaporensis]SDP79915.1 Tripartite-type tricarboxylate transporter, receptor component TctC [Desulforhopalus singaporensis]
MQFAKSARWITLILLVLSLTTPIVGVNAAEYPNKPVKMIVPWAPGGITDTAIRSVVTAMGKYFPSPIVVENRPGGAGTVGTTLALMAKPDGYTVLATAWGPLVTQPSLKKLQYNAESYTPVCQVAAAPRIICAHPDRPYNNLKEMMEYAKKNPGEIKVGIAGVGTTGHLAMAALEQQYDVKFTMVPLGGGGPQKTNLIGGHVDVAPPNSPTAGPAIQAKQIKALGVASEVRFADLPDIPTCAEQGYPLESGVSIVVLAPKGTPAAIVEKLAEAFKKSTEDEELQKLAKKINLNLEYLGSEATGKKLKKFHDFYAGIIEKLGLAKE